MVISSKTDPELSWKGYPAKPWPGNETMIESVISFITNLVNTIQKAIQNGQFKKLKARWL